MKTYSYAGGGIVVIVLIIVGIFLFAPHTRDVQVATTASSTPQVASTTGQIVSLRDTYRRGAHTISGDVVAPNPCTLVSATSTLVGTASTSQRIAVALNMPRDTGICLQEPKTMSFSTTLTAPKGLPISVRVNGTLATTTGTTTAS